MGLVFHPFHGLGRVKSVSKERRSKCVYFNKINMEMDVSNSELTAIPYDTSSIMYYNNDLYEVDNVSCDDRTNTVQFKISTFDVGDKKLTIDVNRGDKKIAAIPKDMQHKLKKARLFVERSWFENVSVFDASTSGQPR